MRSAEASFRGESGQDAPWQPRPVFLLNGQDSEQWDAWVHIRVLGVHCLIVPAMDGKSLAQVRQGSALYADGGVFPDGAVIEDLSSCSL